MGSQVAFSGPHLMDSSRHKFTQPHKRVWGQGRGVSVVRGCRIVGDPVLDEHVPSAGPEGLVGFSHEVWWGDLCSGRGGGVKYQGEASEALL